MNIRELRIKELRDKMIHIAESFNEWIETTAQEYNMSKDDVQDLIKQFLVG